MAGLNRADLKEIAALRQKATEMFKQTQTMLHTCFDGLMKNDIQILDQVLNDEDKLTKVFNDLTALAIENSKGSLSEEGKRKIADLVDVICAIERIGDACVDLVERIEYKIRDKLLFSEAAVQEYKDLHSKVEQTLSNAIEVMGAEDKRLAKKILENKPALDALVDRYRASHIFL